MLSQTICTVSDTAGNVVVIQEDEDELDADGTALSVANYQCIIDIS